MDVRDRGLDAEAREVGQARDHVAPVYGRALLAHHPGDDSVAVGLGGAEVELALRLPSLLGEGGRLDVESLELGPGRALGALLLLFELAKLDRGLGFGQLRLAPRLLGDEAGLEELACPRQLRAVGLELEVLDLGPAPHVGELGREVLPGPGLLVQLQGEVAVELLEVQHRLREVQLQDGLALLHAVARLLQDADDPGLHGAREHGLALGLDGAGGRDRGLDRPRLDARGADAVAAHRGAQQPRQARDQEGGDGKRGAREGHPLPRLPLLELRVQWPVHRILHPSDRSNDDASKPAV